MTYRIRLAAAACAFALSSGAALADTQYVKIADGPDYEFSKAKCEIGAMDMEQQVNAHGSVGFVIAAELGNAIGNAIRMAQYTERCMIMHGWKKMRVEDARQVQAKPARAYRTTPRSALVSAEADPQGMAPVAASRPATSGDIYGRSSAGYAAPAPQPRAQRGTSAQAAADRPGQRSPFKYMQD